MEEYLKIGTVVSTHGLKGEVKVFPTTDNVRRYDDLITVFIDVGRRPGSEDQESGNERRSRGPLPGISVEVERVRYFKNLVIVKFRGVDCIADAEPYLKMDLYVMRNDAVPLGENEYFISDIIGLEVVDGSGDFIGVVKDVMATGANDVYIVSNSDNPKKELLIPAIQEVVRKIDLEEGKMTVQLMEGLE